MREQALPAAPFTLQAGGRWEQGLTGPGLFTFPQHGGPMGLL